MDQLLPAAAPVTVATPEPAAKPKDALKDSFAQAIMEVVVDEKLDMPAKVKKIKEILKAQEKALGIIADEMPGGEAPDGQPPAAALSHKPADPMLLSLARKSRRQDLDGLVAAGKLSPAVRDKLSRRWLPADDRALSLSLTAAGCEEFDTIIEAFRENAPVEMGERTRGQTLSLAHPSVTPDADAAKFRDDTAANVRRLAGMKT